MSHKELPPGMKEALSEMVDPCAAQFNFCADNCCVLIEVNTLSGEPLDVAQILHGLLQIQSTILQRQAQGVLKGNKGFKPCWQKATSPAPEPKEKKSYFGEGLPN